MQLNLFVDPDELIKDRNLQTAVNSIKAKYGKNSILRGMNLYDHSTAIQRNRQIGGHSESGFLIIDNDMIPLGDIYSFSV